MEALAHDSRASIDDHRHAHDRAVSVLVGDALGDIVDMVFRRVGGDRYEAEACDGRVRFRRTGLGDRWIFEILEVSGRNPLARQSTGAWPSVSAEQADLFPGRDHNTYPFAYERVAQLFDSANAPDLFVQHTSRHNWGDRGGHVGEHGSLSLVASRAPLIFSGAGVRPEGAVPRTCQLVDLAPTMLSVLGASTGDGLGATGQRGHDRFLRRQDGSPLPVVDDEVPPAEHLVAFLMDGTNANVLYDMIEAGDAPNLARLMHGGTAYRNGAIASLPSTTLPNHTTILTGAHPGHHGILESAWIDRRSGERIVADSPAAWPWAMQHLEPSVETLHHAVKRSFPAATTASINEFCDTGADFSSFDRLRRGEIPDASEFGELRHVNARWAHDSVDYAFYSSIDHAAVCQFEDVWSGRLPQFAAGPPTFTWVNLTLTDAAFHENGPYSTEARAGIQDTDARIGEMVSLVERRGVHPQTAFVVTADHGMEQNDPDTTGSWIDALTAVGIPVRHEAEMFVYLDAVG